MIRFCNGTFPFPSVGGGAGAVVSFLIFIGLLFTPLAWGGGCLALTWRVPSRWAKAETARELPAWGKPPIRPSFGAISPPSAAASWLRCPALPCREDKIISVPFLRGAFDFDPSCDERGRAPTAVCFGIWLGIPTRPVVTLPCCFSRAMAKGLTTASTGTCRPTTAYLHHHSWELD